MTGKAHEVERLFNAVRVVYATRNLTMSDSPLAREVVKGSRRIHAEEKKDIDSLSRIPCRRVCKVLCIK